MVIAALALLFFNKTSAPHSDVHSVSETIMVNNLGGADLVGSVLRKDSEDELSISAPMSKAALIVRVLSEKGEPVEGAKVSVADLGNSTNWHEGETNDKGLATFKNCPILLSAIARQNGHLSSIGFLDRNGSSSLPAEVTVRFSSERIIRGQVVRLDGAPLAGAKVAAIPLEYGLSERDLALGLSKGATPVLEAVADLSGFFELNVPKEQAFRISAGFPGFASASPSLVLRDEFEVLIQLEPVFGAVIRFDLNSEPNDWNWSIFSESIYPSAPIRIRVPDQSSLILGGYPASFIGFRSWPYFAVVSLGAEDVESAGDLTLSGTFPGFETFDVSVPFNRLTGEVPVNILHLDSKVDFRGQLKARFVDYASSAIESPEKEISRGSIYLIDGENRRIHSPIWNLSKEILLTGIPEGDYSVIFSYDGKVLNGQPSYISVRSEEEVNVDFDLSNVGSVELDLRGPSGRPIWGRVSAVVSGPIDGESQDELDFSFSGRPYLVDLLNPGLYSFRLYANGNQMARFKIHALPGHTRTMPIYLSE